MTYATNKFPTDYFPCVSENYRRDIVVDGETVNIDIFDVGGGEDFYRVVRLNVTPEIEIICMLLESYLSISCMTSVKQPIQYFHFRCKMQLDLPAQTPAAQLPEHGRVPSLLLRGQWRFLPKHRRHLASEWYRPYRLQ